VTHLLAADSPPHTAVRRCPGRGAGARAPAAGPRDPRQQAAQSPPRQGSPSPSPSPPPPPSREGSPSETATPRFPPCARCGEGGRQPYRLVRAPLPGHPVSLWRIESRLRLRLLGTRPLRVRPLRDLAAALELGGSRARPPRHAPVVAARRPRLLLRRG